MAPLTRMQEQKLRSELERQRTGRLSAARDSLHQATHEHYAAFAGEVPDFGDQATAAQLADFQNSVAKRSAGALRAIDDALERIAEHRFGRCLSCGDDIEFGRLYAYPTAIRCVTCQEQHDRTYAREATPTM